MAMGDWRVFASLPGTLPLSGFATVAQAETERSISNERSAYLELEPMALNDNGMYPRNEFEQPFASALYKRVRCGIH
jgi:hypothetical protein